MPTAPSATTRSGVAVFRLVSPLAALLLALLPLAMAFGGGGRNRIEIIITAVTHGLERGLRSASQLVRNFGSTMRGMGSVAASVWSSITQGIFFTTQALQTLGNIARGVFDLFLGQAIDARRLEATFENMTGSAELAAEMVAHLEETSQSLGISFNEVALSGQQLAVAVRGADGSIDLDRWHTMLGVLQDFSALRPDVPLQLMARGVTAAMAGDMTTLTRLLDVNVNKLLGLQEVAEDVTDLGGQLQGVAEARADDVGQAAEGGIDALLRLRELLGAEGLAVKLSAEFEGLTGQAREEFKSLMQEIGDELLPTVNDGLRELLAWYRENEDDFRAFFENAGKFVADAIEGVDWGKVAADATKLVEAIGDGNWGEFVERMDSISGFFGDTADAIERISNSPILNWLNDRMEASEDRAARAEETGARGIIGLFEGQTPEEAFAHLVPPASGSVPPSGSAASFMPPGGRPAERQSPPAGGTGFGGPSGMAAGARVGGGGPAAQIIDDYAQVKADYDLLNSRLESWLADRGLWPAGGQSQSGTPVQVRVTGDDITNRPLAQIIEDIANGALMQAFRSDAGGNGVVPPSRLGGRR